MFISSITRQLTAETGKEYNYFPFPHRILLEHLKTGSDKQFQDKQAVFRPRRSGTNQKAVLFMIVEQSIEM